MASDRKLPAWWLEPHLMAYCDICGKALFHGACGARNLAEAEQAGGWRSAHCLRQPACGSYRLVVVGDGREESWLERDLARLFHRRKGPPAEALARARQVIARKEAGK